MLPLSLSYGLIWEWISNMALGGLMGSLMSFPFGPLNQIFLWWRPLCSLISLSEFPTPHLLSQQTHSTNFFFFPSMEQITIYPALFYVLLFQNPHWKTASEVATLSYVSNHTSITVPKVIAYNPSLQNDLGFEWILMTCLLRVPLTELWSTLLLSWQGRVYITKKISEYIRQMQVLHSNKMGILYLSD